jgi:hypothetical protein
MPCVEPAVSLWRTRAFSRSLGTSVPRTVRKIGETVEVLMKSLLFAARSGRFESLAGMDGGRA